MNARLLAVLFVSVPFVLAAATPDSAQGLLANPSFELGTEGWQPSKAGKTECRFTVDDREAADGQQSALLTIGKVEDWGVQFGQTFAAGRRGQTYTLAAFAKSTEGPAEVSLQIERSASPWDRAANSGKLKLTKEWQEFHVTFTVEKDFPEGWFAYLNCTQPQVQLRLDAFRLYPGSYVPYAQTQRQQIALVAVRVFDTGTAAGAALAGEALTQRTGWTELAEDDLAHVFKGSAVLMNDRMALALRQKASAAELYSLGSSAPALRTRLAPATGAKGSVLSSFKLVENNPGAGAVEAVFTAPDGKTAAVRYELKVGQPFVLTEPRGGAASLRVEAPCRFAIMPDFFADDIVIDAGDLSVAQAELPSDNFLLHLLPGGDAIVMTVAKTSEEDVLVNLSGSGEERKITSSEIRFGKEGKIWVGVMTGTGIWHQRDIAREQAGQVVRLDWTPPFPAQWRVDWRRQENLTDSWEMVSERPDGRFAKHSVYGGPETIPANRRRWTTVLGEFNYPAWVDRTGQGYLQPFRGRALSFVGPAIIYPLSRVPATALDTFTVVDLVRNTLGVGPCQYILDVEGQQSAYKGRATCSVRDTLNPIYVQHQQLQRQAEIEKVLVDLMIFIRHIRTRIEGYVAFGHETLAYLAEQKKAHPDWAESLGQIEAVARGIDEKVAARKERIKTPDEAAAMVQEFRQTVLKDEGPEALAKCKRFTTGWVDIGGNQDELVGECRWAVKMIRQKAGLVMANDPRVAEAAKEIRRRSQIVLRNPAGHESARH